jgi:hypothetical protein
MRNVLLTTGMAGALLLTLTGCGDSEPSATIEDCAQYYYSTGKDNMDVNREVCVKIGATLPPEDFDRLYAPKD